MKHTNEHKKQAIKSVFANEPQKSQNAEHIDDGQN